MSGDGCDCPAYIERCAHWEGTRLFLTDRHHPTADDIVRRLSRRYLMGVDELRDKGTVSYPYCGNDHDEALAAFHEAEEALLA
jgi:hypothetical protein